MPFTDPIADGPTIQTANTVRLARLINWHSTKSPRLIILGKQVALQHGVTIESSLEIVKTARSRGLKAPVIFMGYYNPLLNYGEERLLKDCQDAGVNGFIVVDLPPEEAVSFRKLCSKGR